MHFSKFYVSYRFSFDFEKYDTFIMKTNKKNHTVKLFFGKFDNKQSKLINIMDCRCGRFETLTRSELEYDMYKYIPEQYKVVVRHLSKKTHCKFQLV